MSLYKQLWLAIVLLLTIVFSVSFLVTTLSARTYLEEQLSMKNVDNANALALSLTGAALIMLFSMSGAAAYLARRHRPSPAPETT